MATITPEAPIQQPEQTNNKRRNRVVAAVAAGAVGLAGLGFAISNQIEKAVQRGIESAGDPGVENDTPASNGDGGEVVAPVDTGEGEPVEEVEKPWVPELEQLRAEIMQERQQLEADGDLGKVTERADLKQYPPFTFGQDSSPKTVQPFGATIEGDMGPATPGYYNPAEHDETQFAASIVKTGGDKLDYAFELLGTNTYDLNPREMWPSESEDSLEALAAHDRAPFEAFIQQNFSDEQQSGELAQYLEEQFSVLYPYDGVEDYPDDPNFGVEMLVAPPLPGEQQTLSFEGGGADQTLSVPVTVQAGNGEEKRFDLLYTSQPGEDEDGNGNPDTIEWVISDSRQAASQS